MNSTLAILTVCTGNICRSPAAERLLAAPLGPAARVSSAGTWAVVDSPIAPPMAALVEAAGGSAAAFAARQIREPMVRAADRILTATVEHRSAVVGLAPHAMKRTFTLLEFARAAALADRAALVPLPLTDRVRLIADEARLARPRLRLTPAELDVPDPFGASDDVFRSSFALIQRAAATIAATLLGN
ncbi:MAG: hypothetical protein LBI33_02930 [Propionibacteriaceae bacterium]|jgi:protein-tyrosine phosphatase|nr:hypothetical protein [Propionibacteriaceae bacterium]